MRSNAAKTTKSRTQHKSASSSTKSKRSPVISKSSVSSNSESAAAQLDGVVYRESTTVEGATGDRVFETAGSNENTSGDDLPSESELTVITLHQPWASLVAVGLKHYETRSWYTDYRGSIAIHAAKKLHEDKSLTSLLEIQPNEIPLGAIVAIAELTDCILMDKEFILKQSSFEQYLGLWEVGRYAWKLENVRAIAPIPATGKQGLWKWNQEAAGFDSLHIYPLQPWNPADFGELHHKAEADGQLNLLEWRDTEPPDPDDYEFREQFEEAYKEWAAAQTDEAEEELANFGEQELCDILMDGSICAAESVQDSPMPESNCGEDNQTNSAKETVTAATSLNLDTLQKTESLQTYTTSTATEKQTLLQLPLPVNHLLKMEKDAEPVTQETVSQQSLQQSEAINQDSQLLKTSSDSLLALTPPAINQEATSATSWTPYRQMGTMQNGLVSGVTSLPLRGVGKDYLLLRSPGALSTTTGRPPGKTRLESQLQELNLISAQEVVAPEFLESGYQLPIGWTNLQENRTALELSQVQAQQSSIVPSSESLAETATIETDEKLSAIAWTGESPLSDSNGLNISQDLIESWTEWEKNNFLWLFEFDFCMHKGELKKIEKFLPGTKTIRLEGMQIGSAYLQMWEVEPPRFVENKPGALEISLPPNIGALEKAELISMAQEQHQLICVIERKEFELALEKLHRVRVTGICLMEFKKRCRYGEFVEQLEACSIGVRTAQGYMTVAKNWETIEAKAQLVALLPENNERPTLGIKWALEVVRDEKKQLKSAAPPKDPDGWRTPNTSDQPVVSLVKKALGGQIYLDPASDSGCNIPATMRYFKWNDGLAKHNIWEKTVFINPPFSDPFPWVERCCLEVTRGNVSAAVMLLKAGVVSNTGTGELIKKYASALCHWTGRINFLNDEGNPIKGSNFDCVFVYFGSRFDLFREAFGGRGTIATIENHYSSINKKYLLKSEIPEFGNTQAEQKQLAAAVGLGNGRSVLPDMRDADRELMERYDPHTVVDVFSSSMATTPTKPLPVSENLTQPIAEPEIFDETPLVARQFEKAKENCLNDYITAVSGNITEFSDEQLKFLLENINKEVDRRNNQRSDPEFQQRLKQSLLDKLHS